MVMDNLPRPTLATQDKGDPSISHAILPRPLLTLVGSSPRPVPGERRGHGPPLGLADDR
jgi:hypothetical protein